MSRPEITEPRSIRAWAGVGAAALVAAAIVPSGPPGIGFLLVGLAVAAAVARARPRPLDVETAGWAGAALLLLSMAALRDADWLLLVDVAAAAGCAAVAMTGAATWPALLKAPFLIAGRSFRVPAAVARTLPRRDAIPWAGPAARALAVSTVLLVTFGALFWSADAAFARLAGDVLFPDVDAELLPARILVGLMVAAGAGGLVLTGFHRAAAAPAEADPFREPRRLTTVEWLVPLALLDVLFAAFVVVQVAVLFGGHRHVLTTQGLTYAQYARSGFFQLVAIAALVLGVVALARKVVRDPAREVLLKALLGILCALTLVVLASALRRMDLYEAVYGLTRIRVSVYAVILWLAGLLALVMLAGAVRKAPWLPRAALALTVVSLLAFNVANPDGRIAASAVERWRETGELDRYYVSTLSADAVPALTELPPEERGCIFESIAAPLGAGDPWSSFNLARDRARGLLPPKETTCTSQ